MYVSDLLNVTISTGARALPRKQILYKKEPCLLDFPRSEDIPDTSRILMEEQKIKKEEACLRKTSLRTSTRTTFLEVRYGTNQATVPGGAVPVICSATVRGTTSTRTRTRTSSDYGTIRVPVRQEQYLVVQSSGAIRFYYGSTFPLNQTLYGNNTGNINTGTALYEYSTVT